MIHTTSRMDQSYYFAKCTYLVNVRRENLYFDYLLEHVVEIRPQKKL
jgi:hypothetical protein